MIKLQAKIERNNLIKLQSQNLAEKRKFREQLANLDYNKKNRETVMKQLDKTLDINGMNDPQNVNLLPFQDLSRVNQRRQISKNVVQQNHDIENRKRKLKEEEFRQKQEDKLQQDQLTQIAKEMENDQKMRKKKDNQTVMDYWREQEANRLSNKKLQRMADDVDGKKYIEWVNEFSDKYNNESFQIYENTAKRFVNQAKLTIDNTLPPESPLVKNGYGGDGRNFERSPSFKSEVSIKEQTGGLSNSLNHDQLREKYKKEYVKQLNQQLAEKKIRKKLERQMDPQDRMMNQQYILSLLDKKKVLNNPILNCSGGKFNTNRKVKREDNFRILTVSKSMIMTTTTLI